MTIEFGLLTLAEYAKAQDDRTFSLIGGGIHNIQVASRPYTHPHLSVAVEFRLSGESVGRQLPCQFAFLDPDGEAFEKPAFMMLSPGRAASQSVDGVLRFPFVYNLQNVIFQKAGTHIIRVQIGDTAATLPLTVIDRAISEAPSVSVSTPTNQALESGYAAFQSGEVSQAEAIFSRVVEDAPDDPSAHNNLGFVFLELGKVSDALQEFETAEKLGFVFPELLAVNRGCAQYLLGEYSEALTTFEGCFRRNFKPAGATLFGLHSDSVFAVGLESATDYAWLVALNASWASIRFGNRDTATRYVNMADAREKRSVMGDDEFRASIDAVRSMLVKEE